MEGRVRIPAPLCVFAAFLLLASAVFAQQPAPAGGQSGANPIHLDVVVTGRNGVPVAGLTQQDFTVLDNKAPQQIQSFRAVSGSGAQVGVIVVIDDVNTFYSTIAYERIEISKFFRANGGKLAYPTTLAIFSDTGTQMLKGFSTNGNELAKALDKYTISLRAIQRSAGFYGAAERLQMSIRTLQQLAEFAGPLPGRKFILWMSPGWPILTGPRISISDKQQRIIFDQIVRLSTDLRQAGVTLYAIDPLGTADVGLHTTYYQDFLKGVRKKNDASFGNLSLEVIAAQSGGLVLNSNNDVTALMQRAVGDASAYYELSFNPAPGEPNEYHQIEVKVSRPGLKARTRTGYYSLH